MKKVFSILMVAFAMTAMATFASCDKDETSPIVGTWEYHETDTNIVREYTETMSFKDDGTMSVWFTCYDTYPEGGAWHYGISFTGPYTIDGSILKLKLYHNGIMNSEDTDFTYYEPDYNGETPRECTYTFEISGNTLKIDKGGDQLFGHGGNPGVMEYIKK
ncbi:MAG: hypothetical protein IJK07_10040 [Bacteroidales bacterium]|nr:hypothetical protein [Bacteroidales bacterium]